MLRTSINVPEELKKELATAIVANPFFARREINNRSFYEFVKYFWDEVSNDDFVDNWHIELFCTEAQIIAERVGRKEPKLYDLVVNIPPGMTKTKVWSILFPVWCWTRWYWLQFITGSYSGALSLESAESSRDLVRSDKFKRVYPDIEIKEDKDTKSNFKVVKKVKIHPKLPPKTLNGGYRFSTSVGGTLTGFHGHVQIIDDPLDPRRAASDVELQKANHWCDQTLSSRKTNKKVTVLIIIQQRLHEDDPSGHLLHKKNKRIRHLCLPGEIRNYGKYLNPPELAKFYIDDLLDANRLGWPELDEMMADLGQFGYAGQVGQNPVPPGGGMFQVDHFQIVQTMPENINFVIRYWDKAGTEKGGKRTAGVKMASLKDGRFIVLDVKKGQWGAMNREKIMKETAIADGRHVRIWVEQEPGSGGKESAESTIRNLAGFSCYAENPTGEKEVRAEPFSVQVNNGNVLILNGMWNRDYIEELQTFPFGLFKDQVDASSGAFNKLTSKKTARMLTVLT